MKKYFILDTNVLLHDPNSIFSFEEHTVVIPFTVLEELDNFKSKQSEIGRNARQVIRQLDALRKKRTLGEKGVELENGGELIVNTTIPPRPALIKEDTPDNRILAVAHDYHQNVSEASTVMISKDINVRLKADAIRIKTEDYTTDKINTDDLYTGHSELEVNSNTVDGLHREGTLPLPPSDKYEEVIPNQFVLFKDEFNPSHTGMGIRKGDEIHRIKPGNVPIYGLVPRNMEQVMAMNLLLDNQIRLVTICGQAGTGKTILALAAGMSQLGRYSRIIVARPIMPMGNDLGYLPGDKDEKLGPWMQPIFDNLTFLESSNLKNDDTKSRTPDQRVDDLIGDGKVQLEALTYIRGRSIPNQYMIVDEAQNLTPHEVKTIISRVGKGTKLVLTGDIAQIDSPYLDSESNGLTYAIDKLKESSLTGHITLTKGERSELATLAAEKL